MISFLVCIPHIYKKRAKKINTRFYQALEAAGQDAKLDVYEGMWHVFQTAPSPETEVSLQKIKMFFNKHLGI